MIRSDMNTLARTRIKDSQKLAFTDVQVNTELNAAAVSVSMELARLGKTNYAAGSESFTTVSGQASYDLASTDFERVWKMIRTDQTYPVPCREILEIISTDNDCNVSGGAWLFFVTRNATTGVYTINFPSIRINGGMTFKVLYHARCPSISTDGSGDSSSYTMIPSEFHELVVQTAVISMLGTDSSLSGDAGARLTDLRQALVLQTAFNTSPRMIRREF